MTWLQLIIGAFCALVVIVVIVALLVLVTLEVTDVIEEWRAERKAKRGKV